MRHERRHVLAKQLITPTAVRGFTSGLSSDTFPRATSTAVSNAAAIATRSSINTIGPNSGAALRMTRNEPPHSAARRNKSIRSLGFTVSSCRAFRLNV